MPVRLSPTSLVVPFVVAAALLFAGCGEKEPLPGGGPIAIAPKDAGAQQTAIASLDLVKGDVQLERDGKRSAAAGGALLYVKDAVETGADGEAHVRFHGDRVVELGPDGRLVITEDASGIVLQVDKGLVLTRIPAEGAARPDNLQGAIGLSILTPFGVTRVGNASEVQVAIGPDGAKVDVRVGTVELISRNGEKTNANEGDTLSLTTGAVQFVSRGRQIQLQPVEVVLAAVTGHTDIKKKDQKAFKAAGKKPVDVANGDTIRTQRDGKATLQLAGSESRIQLQPATEAVFDGSGRGADTEEANVQLKKGQVSLSLRQGVKSRVSVGGLTLEADRGGHFAIQKTGDGYDVSSILGDATLLREGVPSQRILSGQRVKLTAKGAKVDEAERAELVLPSRMGLKVFHSGLPAARLSWEGKGDFNVVVSSDPAFKDVQLAGVAHQSSVDVPIPSRGTLFWKVTTADGKEVDKGSATFAPEPQQKDLARNRNEVPEGTETTTIYFQDKPPAVTFSFAERANAASYKITVYRSADLSRPAAERTVSQTSAPLEAGVLTEGSYRWAVTPILKNGAIGESSARMNKLDIVYDNSVPQLVVKSPKNGEHGGGTVPVSGVAPVGARVFINGKPAPLDDKNRFEGSATPIGRNPIVVFRMTRSSEPDVYTVRTLRRGR